MEIAHNSDFMHKRGMVTYDYCYRLCNLSSSQGHSIQNRYYIQDLFEAFGWGKFGKPGSFENLVIRQMVKIIDIEENFQYHNIGSTILSSIS